MVARWSPLLSPFAAPSSACRTPWLPARHGWCCSWAAAVAVAVAGVVVVVAVAVAVVVVVLLLLLSSCHRVIVSSCRHQSWRPLPYRQIALIAYGFGWFSMVSKKSDIDMNGFDSRFMFSSCRSASRPSVSSRHSSCNMFQSLFQHMEVSWNGGAPKSSMFKRYSIINHTVFLGYLQLWKHPYHIFPSWIGSPVLNGAGKRSDTSKEVRLGSFWLGENRGFLGPQTEKDPMAELISGFSFFNTL